MNPKKVFVKIRDPRIILENPSPMKKSCKIQDPSIFFQYPEFNFFRFGRFSLMKRCIAFSSSSCITGQYQPSIIPTHTHAHAHTHTHTHTCVDEKTYIAKPIATMSGECGKGGSCQLLIDYTCQMFMIE